MWLVLVYFRTLTEETYWDTMQEVWLPWVPSAGETLWWDHVERPWDYEQIKSCPASHPLTSCLSSVDHLIAISWDFKPEPSSWMLRDNKRVLLLYTTKLWDDLLHNNEWLECYLFHIFHVYSLTSVLFRKDCFGLRNG